MWNSVTRIVCVWIVPTDCGRGITVNDLIQRGPISKEVNSGGGGFSHLSSEIFTPWNFTHTLWTRFWGLVVVVFKRAMISTTPSQKRSEFRVHTGTSYLGNFYLPSDLFLYTHGICLAFGTMCLENRCSWITQRHIMPCGETYITQNGGVIIQKYRRKKRNEIKSVPKCRGLYLNSLFCNITLNDLMLYQYILN